MIAESVSVALVAALAAVVVAVLGLIGVLVTSRSNAKQMKPNGGASMRDVADRTEAKIDAAIALIHTAVIPRLDAAAIAISNHADRLAVVEDRNAIVDLANRVHAVESQTAVTAAALATPAPRKRKATTP